MGTINLRYVFFRKGVWLLVLLRGLFNPLKNNGKKPRGRHEYTPDQSGWSWTCRHGGTGHPKWWFWIREMSQCLKKSSLGIIGFSQIFLNSLQFFGWSWLPVSICFLCFPFFLSFLYLFVYGTIYVSLSIPFPVSTCSCSYSTYFVLFLACVSPGIPVSIVWMSCPFLCCQSRGIPAVQYNFPYV